MVGSIVKMVKDMLENEELNGVNDIIIKLKKDLKCALEYSSDMEGIIGRQRNEIDILKDELKIRGSELNKKTVEIERLKRVCRETKDELNVKIMILKRKICVLEGRLESMKV